jgi:hypothetical protein
MQINTSEEECSLTEKAELIQQLTTEEEKFV